MPSSNNSFFNPGFQEPFLIKIAARSSPLSQVQVMEIQTALQRIHPHIQFDAHYLSTVGDRDQTTSLRFLGKTDFFTQDIDLLVLQKECRLGIHSAKDLPEPLADGLKLFCLTEGKDPSDSLVLPPFMTLHSLPLGACIGTSSLRREECIRNLRSDLTFKDIRGTIEQRLSQLEKGEIDGVVIAEAALIRLGLTHLNRIRVPGTTTAGQGQLGVVGRADDHEMEQLFASLDVRASFQIGSKMAELALYLGLDPTHYRSERKLIHCPLIKIIPKPVSDPLIKRALEHFEHYTHLVITSKSTVEILCNFLFRHGISMSQWRNKYTLAVGQATGKQLLACGIEPACIAKEETAEGVVEEIKKMDLKEASFFWPHSFRARAVIKDFFEKEGIKYTACPFYNTEAHIPDPLPRLNDFKEIIFTSPSTVDAFLKIYGEFPSHLLLTPIGPVTSEYLQTIKKP